MALGISQICKRPSCLNRDSKKSKSKKGGNETYEHTLAQNALLFSAEPYASARIVDGSLLTICQKPKYADLEEWLAANSNSPLCTPRLLSPAFDFFHHLNLYYGVVSVFCSPQSCPTMMGAVE